MITRAQAEALLTLAESLEACERSGLEVLATFNSVSVFYAEKRWVDLGWFKGMDVRLAVESLIPKQKD